MIDRIVQRSLPLFRFISAVFLVSCTCSLQAQDRLLPAYRFARITTQNGLPSNEIRSNVVRDRRGFYWIGTLNGLARYDGRTCKVYRNIPGDPHSLPKNTLLRLHLDRRGLLWIGTFNAGLSIYDPATDRFVNIPPESTKCGWTSPAMVFSLHEDPSGNIWIASGKDVILADLSQAANETSAEGVVRLARFRLMASGGFGQKVNYIDDWDEQSVLISSHGGIYSIDKATGVRKDHLLPSAPGVDLDTTAVMISRWETPNRIWFGTLSQGLVLFDRAKGIVRRYYRRPKDIVPSADYIIYAMQFDKNGRLWLGTRDGLDFFDPSSGLYLNHIPVYSQNIPPRLVWYCERDDAGNLWFGTADRGIYVLRSSSCRLPLYGIPGEDGRPRNMETIERNADGTYWISTEGRTVRVDLSTFRILQNVDIFGKDKPFYGRKGVWDSYRDKNGNIWYGTWGCGLYRFDPSTDRVSQFRFTKQRFRRVTSSDACISISSGPGDSLWIAAYKLGMLLFDLRTGTFSERSPLSQFDLADVWHIMRDRQGRMWVSDQLAGLMMFDPASQALSRFQHHADQPGSISNSLVYGTFEDAEGRIWVGSDMINLWQPETKTFQHFPKARRFGPPFDAVYAVPLGSDRHGKLWINYYVMGIDILDPATGENMSFTAADGLCGGTTREMSLIPDGRVMLVGSFGMNLISPDSLSAPTAPPPVVISAVIVNDSSLAPKEWMSPGSIVQLPHDQNTLEFEFAAIDPAVPEDIRCSYRLEGLDESWISPPDRYYARYPGLQPGSYRLRVKASSLLGHWPDQEISLAISISPPWWHTLWFRAVLVLVLASALYGLYRYRMSKILALERVRLRIADDLHDDIGSELSGIALESDLIARQLPAGTPQQTRLLMLGQTVRKASGDLHDVVWFVNPEFDKLPDLIARMRTVADKMLTGHQVTFDIPADIPPVPLGMEFKRHLLMMFKEMLNNIVRHAKAQNVRILFELEGMHFKLCVKDDGIGFDTSTESAGRGLVLMRSRTTAIGGRCTLKSGPDSGTTICIEGDIIRSED